MTVLIEGRHPGEFLMSEANRQRSRGNITIASGAGIIAPGTVLGKVTASGKYVASAIGATNGSETAVAVALYGCDAISYQWPEYLTHFFGFKFWQTLNQ